MRAPTQEPLRVLLVDGKSLNALIESVEGARIIGTAASLRDALQATDDLPDLVVVEQTHLDRSATEATHTLRGRAPGSPVVLFAGERDEDTLIDVIVAGAAAYLPLDLSADSLSALLGCAARGGVALDPWAARVLLQRFGAGTAEGGTGLLTTHERALLERLAAAPGACTDDEATSALAASACAKLRDAVFICA